MERTRTTKFEGSVETKAEQGDAVGVKKTLMRADVASTLVSPWLA